MKGIILIPILAAVFVAIVIFFVLRAKVRRFAQAGRNDIDKLKPGKVHHIFELDIPFNKQTQSDLKALLSGLDFRIIEGVENGLIAYSGKSENAALGGWLNIDPMLLPIRITAQPNKGAGIQFRMDDDYGFQVLNATQKEKFQKKNDVKFHFYEEKICSGMMA